MNIAAILALLISSGACGHADFNSPDGGTLQVVICPMVQGPAHEPPAEGDAPKAPPQPAPDPKNDRQAMN